MIRFTSSKDGFFEASSTYAESVKPTGVEQIWHIQDGHGQILALTLR